MKILIVCSANSGQISSFIKEQANSLKIHDIEFEFYGIKGKGVIGYLSNLKRLRKKIRKGNFDIIHAHYGLSGLLANFQRKIPVITTFHGCDLNINSNRKYSKLAALLSCFSILTNPDQLNHFSAEKTDFEIIPCGVDLSLFKRIKSDECRKNFGFKKDRNYILFASSFNRPEKNAELAIKSVELLDNTELIELKGYKRQEVVKLINASSMVLITSFHETGPLIAKEAWACNVPVVSTDVGDVSLILGETLSNKYIVPYNKRVIANKMQQVLNQSDPVELRKLVESYSLSSIALRIKKVYNTVVKGIRI